MISLKAPNWVSSFRRTLLTNVYKNMTSTQLIPINHNKFNNEVKSSINARDLHLFLEVQTKFSDWIKARIIKYEFAENLDFIASEKTEGLNTPQNRVDYFLTLETAKEISMVENNKKGREARRYFIQKEKEANGKQLALPTTYKEALKSLIAEIEEKEKIQIELNQQKETLENISQKKECYGFRETAKKLCVQEKNLKSYLKKKDWIMYLDEELHPTAYATNNSFATISHELNRKQKQFYPQFKITAKGFDFLAKRRQEIIN